MAFLRRPAVAFALFAIVALVPRLASLPAAGWDNLTPDGARFLNLARSIERGLGLVTPEAWPVWLDPARLPMPETIKEPGYPYALAAMTRLTRDPVRAGQWISLLAGLLLPFATVWLVRTVEPDRAVAWVAGLLVAASPLLIVQSVYVMADSLFALLVTVALALAAMRARDRARELGYAAGAGVVLGLAWLVRAQGLTALPVLLGLLVLGRPWRRSLPPIALALAAMTLTLVPWMLRNLGLFGQPFHSDVVAFGLWPYVDPFMLYHGLDRPPAPLGFALAHLGEIARYTLHSVKTFGWHTLPQDLLGSRIWLVPLALGAVVALARGRTWWPLLLFAALNLTFLLPLYWLPRYFSASVPVACALAALGATWLVRPAWERAVAGPVKVAHVAVAWLAALLLVAEVRAVRRAGDTYHPEWAAARQWGPWLEARLAPGEAVMADVTSYWAWSTDRPVVQAPVAEAPRVRAMLARLRVRYAAMTPAFEREYASRLAGGRLPDWVRPVADDTARAIRIYEVRPE